MPEWVGPTATAIATTVAVIAVIVAALARHDSRRSADAAERSAVSSEDSATSAADSAGVARREEARRLERADVCWQRITERGDQQGRLEFRNTGATTAFVVTVVLTVNGERVHLRQDEVPAAGSIAFDASAMGKQVVLAASFGASASYVYGTRFDVQARIAGQSELGTPGVWVYDSSRA